MSILRVTGNGPLEGQLTVQGAKNSVLPLLAATILAPSVSILRNCPDLSDVRASLDILRHLG
ncbi:MAG: UDP-N-acetylglucosamine 1-carboxyvinyltransferase, partial [Oscillospiraceae bacterium]